MKDQDHQTIQPADARRLQAAIRKARIVQAERSDAMADLREADIARLELLAEALEPVIQELNLTYPDLMVVRPPFEGGFNAIDLFEHGDVDSHAGEIETSLMLVIRPDLVKAERVDFVPSVGREFFDYAFLCKWAPDGVTGIASAADADKGRKALAASVERLVQNVRETFAALESLKGSNAP